MKRRAAGVAAALLCSVAVAAGAGENLWVAVQGGDWEPRAHTVARMKERLQAFVEERAKAEDIRLKPWRSYTFQYQGRVQDGARFVFVHAFCARHEELPLEKYWVAVSDGGSCYFNLRYDPERDEFFALAVHGEG